MSYLTLDNQYHNPEWDQSRMAVFEDCQATALTTRPPQPVSHLVIGNKCFVTNSNFFLVSKFHLEIR